MASVSEREEYPDNKGGVHLIIPIDEKEKGKKRKRKTS
jgi:hypothetical protein